MNSKKNFEIGKLVKEHRKMAGLTQKQLAEFASIGKTSVFDIEHDKATVQMQTVLRAFDVLNIEMKLTPPKVVPAVQNKDINNETS